MTSTVNRATRVSLPEGWHVRTRENFDDLFTSLEHVAGVDSQFVAALAADTQPLIGAAVENGLVLLAGFMESIGPEPMPFVREDLEIPFSADDVEPTAIAASLALFERPRPSGNVGDLVASLDRVMGRWLSRPEAVDLPAGPAVVTREVQAVHPPSLKRASDVFVVTYYILPSEEPDLILVALFRSPTLQFATEFDKQFAAIASGIQVVDTKSD